MFADHTKLWSTVRSASDGKMLHDDLNSLKNWSDKWLLKFNHEKCKVMHVGHSIPTEYTLQEDDKTFKLESVNKEKDLGIYVTNNMKAATQRKAAS